MGPGVEILGLVSMGLRVLFSIFVCATRTRPVGDCGLGANQGSASKLPALQFYYCDEDDAHSGCGVRFKEPSGYSFPILFPASTHPLSHESDRRIGSWSTFPIHPRARRCFHVSATPQGLAPPFSASRFEIRPPLFLSLMYSSRSQTF